MSENERRGQAFVPLYLLGPTLREVLDSLYGGSREALVLRALQSAGPVTLSAITRRCSASERAVRNDRKTGWIRAILARYREAGLVIEKNWGNRITFQLDESAPAVALLRELQGHTQAWKGSTPPRPE